MQRKNLVLYSMAVMLSLGIASRADAVSICLDAGHGGSDPGASGCGMIESHNTLDSVKRLQKLLEAAGWTVYQTRTSETTVGLSARPAYANSKGVTTFASIHNNAFNGSATGIETLRQPGSGSGSTNQAKGIQNKMISVWNLANRGAKEQNLAVCRLTNMPATLSELAFIDNCSKDAVYLKSSAHVQNAMKAHCEALVAQWGGDASKCSGSGGGGTTPPPSSQTGTVIAGTYKDSVGDENWLGGVKYTIGSESQTSAATKTFLKFTVAVGAFKATATKDGYKTWTRSDCEPVTAGGTVWCSAILSAEAQAPAKGKATGSVIDGLSNSNVAAKVTVKDGASANYDGNTNWSFDLDAGTYTITASADGYDDNSVSCTVTAGNTASCPITVNPKKGTIKGKVLDAESNAAIAAAVSLGTQKVNYTGEGEWLFTVDEGTYSVEATAPNYEPGLVSCSVKKGGTQNCDITLKPVREETKEKGTITGTITDASTGSLIAGDLELSTGLTYHYTGSDKYHFQVDPGDYKLTATADGYESNTVSCSVASGQTSECSVQLTPDLASVSGIVYLGSDPSTKYACTVTIADQTIEYDGKKNWTAKVKPGQYTVVAQSEEYSGSTECTVEAGKANVCNIAVLGENDETGTLRGIVYDDRNESMLIEATVKIKGYETIKYEGTGKWESGGLPAGSHLITGSAPGYYKNTVSCEVIAGETGYCPIPLTAKAAEGASTENEEDEEPAKSPEQRDSIATIHSSESCSAQPQNQPSGLPVGIAATLLAMLSALGIRRRQRR
ncbi:MAG: N-acetylmuramoyl-L-alanine amidase [Proteobacteria bacterium]|nr:N-acetylmuramoyl-L-alanine amidase [Pseudomonadota bacterium]